MPLLFVSFLVDAVGFNTAGFVFLVVGAPVGFVVLVGHLSKI